MGEEGTEEGHEEVQQRLGPSGAKVGRYDNMTEQYRQNRLFEANQKKLFSELEGVQRETIVPDAELEYYILEEHMGQTKET